MFTLKYFALGTIYNWKIVFFSKLHTFFQLILFGSFTYGRRGFPLQFLIQCWLQILKFVFSTVSIYLHSSLPVSDAHVLCGNPFQVKILFVEETRHFSFLMRSFLSQVVWVSHLIVFFGQLKWFISLRQWCFHWF